MRAASAISATNAVVAGAASRKRRAPRDHAYRQGAKRGEEDEQGERKFDHVRSYATTCRSNAPVIDGKGELIGVLSQKDCLKAALNASYYQEWGGAVSDYMSKEVETLEADLDIVEAAEHFLASNYRRFPVMHEGRIVGQISRADLLRALVENWG